MKKKSLYRVTFVNQEKVYEIYAKQAYQNELFGFVVLEDLVFDETSSVVVDPGQERLKNEFFGVKSTHIPMHSIIRIDEVEKQGVAKIIDAGKETNISKFPATIYTKSPDLVN